MLSRISLTRNADTRSLRIWVKACRAATGRIWNVGGTCFLPWSLGASACPIFEACGIRGELEDQREEIEDTLNMDSLAQCHENHAGIWHVLKET